MPSIPTTARLRPSAARSGRRLDALVILALTLASCGDFGTAEMRARLAQAKSGKNVVASRAAPPGAAGPLSLFGSDGVLASTPFESAVVCATAFRVSAGIFAKTAIFANGNEVQRMRVAAEFFRRRAIAVADSRRADAAIERRQQEVADTPGPQLQLAAGCIRQTGEQGS